MLSRTLHRVFRRMGLQVSRLHDPYDDCAKLLARHNVRNIIDGGAYHGGHGIRLAGLFPNAIVHLFEPTLDTFAALQRTINGQPRLQAHRVALSSTTTQAVLHVHETRFTSSLLASSDSSEMREVDAQQIDAVSLDEWLSARNLPAPEIIKLDLQGHELAALQGASSALRDGVRAVIVEVNFRNRYSGGCVYHEIAHLLSDHGFRLFRLYEIINDANSALRQADALFVRETLLK